MRDEIGAVEIVRKRPSVLDLAGNVYAQSVIECEEAVERCAIARVRRRDIQCVSVGKNDVERPLRLDRLVESADCSGPVRDRDAYAENCAPTQA